MKIIYILIALIMKTVIIFSCNKEDVIKEEDLAFSCKVCNKSDEDMTNIFAETSTGSYKIIGSLSPGECTIYLPNIYDKLVIDYIGIEYQYIYLSNYIIDGQQIRDVPGIYIYNFIYNSEQHFTTWIEIKRIKKI